MAGENEGQQGQQGGDGQQGAQGQQSGAQGGQQGQQGQQGETPEQIIARLQTENSRLEREKQDARIQKEGALKEAAKKQQLFALAQTLGIEGLGTEAQETLETLQTKITGKIVASDDAEAVRAEAREAKVELAVFKAAATDGLDANRLTNSRSFYAAIKDLDPTASTFEGALKAAINAEVTKDPTLKTGTSDATGGTGGSQGAGPAASGAQSHGGSGGGQSTVTQEQFDGMSMLEKNRLFLTDPDQFKRLAG